MIQRMEIRNFESHEYTVLKGFSKGFNLICGLSDTGKSAILRALRLIAYNKFDPGSVRLGTPYCEVAVKTERGVVVVRRGEGINEWDVTPKGEVTQPFSNVGTAILPQAAEIIGLGLITLGDVTISANIMDQLETHFMLAGLGDKDVTGSVRAQIIDEISGLTGIEGIIKAVGLDKSRNGRKIADLEKKVKEIEVQLHDQDELDAEREICDSAQANLDNYYECQGTVKELTNHWSDWNTVKEGVEDLEQELGTLPDEVKAQRELQEASRAYQRGSDAMGLFVKHQSSFREVHRLEGTLRTLPDGAKASRLLKKAREKMSVMKAIDDFCDRTAEALENIESLEKELSQCEKDIVKETKKRDTLILSVKTCPLTLRPVKPECFEGMELST